MSRMSPLGLRGALVQLAVGRTCLGRRRTHSSHVARRRSHRRRTLDRPAQLLASKVLVDGRRVLHRPAQRLDQRLPFAARINGHEIAGILPVANGVTLK